MTVIRQNQRFLTQIYVLSDLLCTLLMFLFSYWLKFGSGLMSHYNTLPLKNYLLWGTIYSFAAILIGFYVRFYAPRRRKSPSYDILKILQVHGLSFLGLLSILFISKEVHISREFLAIFLIANVVGMIAYRYIVKRVLSRLRRKGFNKRYVLILGAGSVGRSFYNNLMQHPELGYEVIGFLDRNKFLSSCTRLRRLSVPMYTAHRNCLPTMRCRISTDPLPGEFGHPSTASHHPAALCAYRRRLSLVPGSYPNAPVHCVCSMFD